MKTLKGKNILETNSLAEFTVNKKVTVDIGTGDGRFAYKMAKNQPNDFVIGIDPAADNLTYADKIIKKPAKGGLSNIIYVIANAFDLPDELNNLADEIYINLPWGSLLEGLIKADEILLTNLKKIGSKNRPCTLTMNLSYSILYEKDEMQRRQLPLFNEEYIEKFMIPTYKNQGINLTGYTLLSNQDLKNLETQWAKQLGFGRKRDSIFRISGYLAKV